MCDDMEFLLLAMKLPGKSKKCFACRHLCHTEASIRPDASSLQWWDDRFPPSVLKVSWVYLIGTGKGAWN